MEIYQKEKMTDSQKQKIKEQDKKHSAKHCLEKKIKNKIKKQNARDHKRKSQSYQEIHSKKFRKHVKKVFSIAGKCPVKTQILVNTFSSVQVCYTGFRAPSTVPTAVTKNHVQEHAKLVTQIKKDYGSLCKASIAMNVHWTTFNQLCKPPQKKNK